MGLLESVFKSVGDGVGWGTGPITTTTVTTTISTTSMARFISFWNSVLVAVLECLKPVNLAVRQRGGLLGKCF